MPWLFQKTVARKSRSAVCPNLRALHDAERKELLRQTQEYEALRFLKDRKVQVSISYVSILPSKPTALCPLPKIPLLFHGVG